MNAELRRNLWLELSPSRMAIMAGVLCIIFGIAWLGAGTLQEKGAALAGIGQGLFGVIVAFWGSFKAGRSVSDEIRERTWDFQRMSALSPAAMTLGKLFGATAYCWFGALITLAALFFGSALQAGWQLAAQHVGQLILLGVIAHAVALATSLAVVRRGRGRDRVDAFVFTIAGLIAFNIAGEVVAGGGGLTRALLAPTTDAVPHGIRWMGLAFSANGWAFFALGLIAVWAVATAWRLMRVELQAPANPLWYPLFLLVPTALAAGRADTLLTGVGIAYFSVHALVVLTLLMEPKDFVAWRSLLSHAGKGGRHAERYWPATLTGLVVAFVTAVGVAIVVTASGPSDVPSGGPLLVLAAFAFLLRETAIFAFFHLGAGQRRGDFAALVTIGLLCVAGPAILGVLHFDTLTPIFFVKFDGAAHDHLLSIAAGLVEAAAFGVAAQARWRGRERTLALA